MISVSSGEDGRNVLIGWLKRHRRGVLGISHIEGIGAILDKEKRHSSHNIIEARDIFVNCFTVQKSRSGRAFTSRRDGTSARFK